MNKRLGRLSRMWLPFLYAWPSCEQKFHSVQCSDEQSFCGLLTRCDNGHTSILFGFSEGDLAAVSRDVQAVQDGEHNSDWFLRKWPESSFYYEFHAATLNQAMLIADGLRRQAALAA